MADPAARASVAPPIAPVDTVIAFSRGPVTVEAAALALGHLARGRAGWLVLRDRPDFYAVGVAIRLMDLGWALRSDVAWSAPGKPRAPTDRPAQTRWHAMLLTRGTRYWYDLPPRSEERPVYRDRGDVWVASPREAVRFMIERTCPPGGSVLDAWTPSGLAGTEALATGRSACFASGRALAQGVRAAKHLPPTHDLSPPARSLPRRARS